MQPAIPSGKGGSAALTSFSDTLDRRLHKLVSQITDLLSDFSILAGEPLLFNKLIQYEQR